MSDPGGYNYLVMELLEGGDLQQTRVREGPFELRRTLSIMAQVASGLGAVHKKQIVHRDVKPENVFLIQRSSQKDFVKLLDFGLAKLSESMKGNEDRTRAGTVLGTPEYMSPEQARGTTVDARSDIYALGLLLHWMLLDRLPWATRDLEELLALREKDPIPLPAETSGREHLPTSIFQTCDELEAALREVDPEDGKPAELFSESTVPMARLAVIGGAKAPQAQDSTIPGATTLPENAGIPKLYPKPGVQIVKPEAKTDVPAEKPAPQPAPQIEARVVKTPAKPRPQAIVIPEEPRRLEIPWLAIALIGSMSFLAYTLYRTKPADRPVLPEAPGSPYGASMMGPSKLPPPEPVAAPLVPAKP